MKATARNTLGLLILALVLTFGYGASASAANIISGFGTLTTDGNMSLTAIPDGNWHARTTDGFGDPSAAVMTATTLTQTNNPYMASYRPYECPVHKIIDNTAGAHSGSRIQVSFDYSVSLGSPRLCFYLSGIDATGGSPNWSGSTTARSGNAWHAEVADVETYNLFDGTLTGQAIADAYNGGLESLTGTGAVSVVIDLSTHATYQDLSDYEYIAATFAWGFDEAAIIEVSNLTVETLPDTTIMKGFGGLTKDSDISSDNIDGNWHGLGGATLGVWPFVDTEAVMTATTLTVANEPFANNDRRYEAPVGRILDNTGGAYSGSTFKLSFDYNVTQGTPSLFVHLVGWDETASAAAELTLSTIARGGASWHTPTDTSEPPGHVYNLFNGSNVGSGASSLWAPQPVWSEELLNATGSGTFSKTVNLGGHTITNLSGYEYIALAFAWDFDEAGTIEVSNLTLEVLPTGTVILLH